MKLRAFPDKPASFRIHRWVKRSRGSFFSVTFKQDIFPIEEDADLTSRIIEKFREYLSADPHIGAISTILGSLSITKVASEDDKSK